MYPYPDRTRWFLGGRYAHLVRALDHRRRALQDTVLEARVESMRLWNRARAVVIVLLSIGVAAAIGARTASLVPAFETAAEVLDRVTALAGAMSGLLTVLYLFLTRLLNQLEADILAILTLDHPLPTASENP